MSSLLPTVPPKEIDLKSLSGLSILQLEAQAEETAYGIRGGLLALCAILGTISNRFLEYESFTSSPEYEAFEDMEHQIERIKSNKKLSDDKKQSKITAFQTKTSYTKAKKQIEEFSAKMKEELGLPRDDEVPTSFHQYIEVRKGFTYLEGRGGSKSSIYEYAKVGRVILENPDVFRALASKINFDNNRKKLVLIPDILESVAKKEDKTANSVAKDKSFIASIAVELRDKKIDDIRARYRLTGAKKKRDEGSDKHSVRGPFAIKRYFSTTREGLLINGEIVLSAEDIRELSSKESHINKMKKAMKECMKEIMAASK
jgi:hypothetical protein